MDKDSITDDDYQRFLEEAEREAKRSELSINATDRLSPVLIEYVKAHSVLITYVRDVYGFRKGVVVAIGRLRIGWSLVNLTWDIGIRQINPEQIPAFQEQIEAGVTYLQLSRHPAFRKWMANRQLVRVPKFDKNLGLLIAIDRAVKSRRSRMGDAFELQWIPNDPDLRTAFHAMLERSKRYFKDG